MILENTMCLRSLQGMQVKKTGRTFLSNNNFFHEWGRSVQKKGLVVFSFSEHMSALTRGREGVTPYI